MVARMTGLLGAVTWWMSFLNFQIEHHLWPSMPELHLPRASLEARRFFLEHGLHYDCRGYGEALTATFHNLKKVGEVEVGMGMGQNRCGAKQQHP